jgi:hypothetical protein
MNDDDVALDESAPCEPIDALRRLQTRERRQPRVFTFSIMASTNVGLRPLTVYGVNRDTGLTSDPTKAMKSAVLGVRFIFASLARRIFSTSPTRQRLLLRALTTRLKAHTSSTCMARLSQSSASQISSTHHQTAT